jgi:hypothetical protein
MPESCRSVAYYYHNLSVNIPRSKNARNGMISVPLYTGEGGIDKKICEMLHIIR